MPVSEPSVFRKIVAGDIPSTEVYRDEKVVAFEDISPVAPVHVLIVPIEHVTFISGTSEEQEPLLGHMMRVAALVAEKKGVLESGYRLVVNQGDDAGQEIDDLHIHVIGGRKLGRIG